jgi:hypothetical protein
LGLLLVHKGKENCVSHDKSGVGVVTLEVAYSSPPEETVSTSLRPDENDGSEVIRRDASPWALPQEPRNIRSETIKAGLKAAKARGQKLGGYRRRADGSHFAPTEEERAKALSVRLARSHDNILRLQPIISAIQMSGCRSLRAIAQALTDRSVPTPRGQNPGRNRKTKRPSGIWAPSQVSRVLKGIDELRDHERAHPQINAREHES